MVGMVSNNGSLKVVRKNNEICPDHPIKQYCKNMLIKSSYFIKRLCTTYIVNEGRGCRGRSSVSI